MATHLITGGNGFLGAFIARNLLARGETVVVVDVINDPDRDTRTTFHQIDILDTDKLATAMRGVNYVHHNAALVPLKKAGKKFWSVNVDGTRSTLDAARRAGVVHFAHMSSSAVFGNLTRADVPIGDDPDHLRPIEIYGESKAAGERIIKDEMKRPGGVSCSIIRPRTIIGTERLGIFQILFEWISEGRNVYIIGDGENLFQFAHVDDLVFASVESCLAKAKGIFNIGTDQYGTLREALEKLCTHAGTGSKVVSIPTVLAITPLQILDKLGLSPLGPWHYLTYHKPYAFDLSTSKRELGWQPKNSNDSMLRESYDWYVTHKSDPRRQNQSAHRGGLKQGVLGLLKRMS